jgi:membrane-bound metal-dependent hydrolase YbcI (DUF457 family)
VFIAHLPAGYLTARLVARRLGVPVSPSLVLAGLAGGIFPDIDLFYATLIDHWSVHHHRYWTHLPLFWLTVSAAALLLFRLTGETRQCTVIFLLAVWSHLLLDSVAGDIWWLWPWLDVPFSLVTIPAIHSPWYLNYLLHWTFALELIFVASGLVANHVPFSLDHRDPDLSRTTKQCRGTTQDLPRAPRYLRNTAQFQNAALHGFLVAIERTLRQANRFSRPHGQNSNCDRSFSPHTSRHRPVPPAPQPLPRAQGRWRCQCWCRHDNGVPRQIPVR